MIPILSIVGKSGVGKTTLIEKLVPALRNRGVSVGIIKHHAHTTPVDVPGKDSWRLAQAGANVVIVSSPVELVRFERVPRELALSEIIPHLGDVNLILTEGFSREATPKVEVSRAALGTDLIARADELIAVVSDHPVQISVPRLGLDDIDGLTASVIARFFG